MSPLDTPKPNNEATPTSETQTQSTIQTTQPVALQSMDPERPHPDQFGSLRGGDRGGCCPGRFCFIIPCPLPCDCCII